VVTRYPDTPPVKADALGVLLLHMLALVTTQPLTALLVTVTS